MVRSNRTHQKLSDAYHKSIKSFVTCSGIQRTAVGFLALDVKTDKREKRKRNCLSAFSIHVLLLTEKFSEMKDEIPQAVIDSHVKNAASARAEKVKQETSEENTGTLYKILLSD